MPHTIDTTNFFIFGIEGVSLSKKDRQFLHSNEVGGIILFKRNIESIRQVIDLNAQIINQTLHYPILLSVDQEGGRVNRLKGICTDIPNMASLSHLANDERSAYRLGAIIGRELSALGFNLNFAPVCDVLTNKDNQAIKDRSFSSCEQIVAQITPLIIKGMQGAGIAACAKHFPGHGDAILDSHFSLPRVNTDLNTIMQREIIPFKAAIKAQVASIMSSHILYETLDENLLATLSPKIITSILKEELNYKGVVISDDLDMAAISDTHSLREIIHLGLLAGIDLFIIGNNFEKMIEARVIYKDLITKSPTLYRCALRAKNKIHTLKSHFVGKPLAPNFNEASKIVKCRPHIDLLASITTCN